MVQEIIVYFIIISVIIYSVYAVVKKIRTKPTSACDGCTGCGIKQEINKKAKNNDYDCSYSPVKN